MTGYIAPTVVDTTIKDGADKLTIEAIATLYNYKLLAAVRENVSNALDANTDNNATDPVTVRITTDGNDNTRFIISDSGKGMSAATLENDYLSIGISSKRDRDDLIGGHGIGVLATFCATTTTTVVTTHEGKTTSAIGTNHGSGHIQWVFNTTDAAETTPRGTTISFDTPASPDEVASIIQWLVMTAYLRDLKIIITDNTPLLSDHGPLADYRASAMTTYTDNDQACIFYPFGVKNNPSTACSYIDLDYLIGVHTGRYTVPLLDGASKNYIPLSSHMLSVNGLAYTVNKAAEDYDNHITIITPDFIDSAHIDLELSSIPRNREYVEAENPHVFDRSDLDNYLRVSDSLNSLAEKVIDYACAIINGYDDYLSHDISADLNDLTDSPSHIVEKLGYPLHELNALIAAGMFMAAGSASTHASPYTSASIAVPQNPLSNMDELVKRIKGDKQAHRRLFAALRNNSVRALYASPNKALNDTIAESTPVHYLVDIWPAVDSTIRSATGNEYHSWEPGESKANFVVLNDAIPDDQPDTLTPAQRSGLADHFTRAARGYLLIHKDDVTTLQLRLLDISFNLYRDSRYYINANILRTPFTRYIGNHPGYGTWKDLTTPPAKKKAKKVTRAWKHAHFTLDGSGVLTYAGLVGLTIDEVRDTYAKPHVIAISPSHKIADNSYTNYVRSKTSAAFPVELRNTILPHIPLTPRTVSDDSPLGYDVGDTVKYWADSSALKVGWAALYNHGVTDVYAYADKPRSTVEKLSRTSWIDTWEKNAVPAVTARKRADDDRTSIQREYNNILHIFCVGSFGNNAIKNLATLALSRSGDNRDAICFLTSPTSLNLMQDSIAKKAISYANQTDKNWLIPWFAEIQFGNRNLRKRFHSPSNFSHTPLPSYLSTLTGNNTDVDTINATIDNLKHILALPGLTAEKMGKAASLYATATTLNHDLDNDDTPLHSAIHDVVRAADDYMTTHNVSLTPLNKDHVVNFFVEHGKETERLAHELARPVVDSAYATWNVQTEILTALAYMAGTSVDTQVIIDSLTELESMYAKVKG